MLGMLVSSTSVYNDECIRRNDVIAISDLD